jgi:hypothetical protein
MSFARCFTSELMITSVWPVCWLSPLRHPLDGSGCSVIIMLSGTCIGHEEKSECMHCGTWWTFPILNVTFLFLVSVFVKWNMLQEWLHDLITIYIFLALLPKPVN